MSDIEHCYQTDMTLHTCTSSLHISDMPSGGLKRYLITVESDKALI
jgi:hypothetical protein